MVLNPDKTEDRRQKNEGMGLDVTDIFYSVNIKFFLFLYIKTWMRTHTRQLHELLTKYN